jgi:hypothetical protein
MTTFSSNQAEIHAVQSQATYPRQQLVQTTITGETHNPLPQHHRKRRIPRNTESQNVFQLKRLTQSNLHSKDMATKDSESFRDTYPPHPGKIAQLSPSKTLAHNVLAFTIKSRQQHHEHLKTAKPE